MALLDAVIAGAPDDGARAEASALNARYGDLDARDAIALAVNDLFPGRIALVSSFGAESAVLLHLLSQVDRTVPVIFLDTGRLFAETLEYRVTAGRSPRAHRCAQRHARSGAAAGERPASRAVDDQPGPLLPDPQDRAAQPRARRLRRLVHRPQALPERRARRAAVCSRRTAAASRSTRSPAGRPSGLKAHAAEHGLPEHPLVAKGYPSIGCVPCTSRVEPGEDARAGRWRGLDKTECGIHTGLESDGSGI